jgi:hypothetical protein
VASIDAWLAYVERFNGDAMGFYHRDYVDELLERNTMFERMTTQANLNSVEYRLLLTAVGHDRPKDMRAWLTTTIAALRKR